MSNEKKIFLKWMNGGLGMKCLDPYSLVTDTFLKLSSIHYETLIVPCGTEVSLINDIDLLNGYDEIIDYVKNTTNLDKFLKPTQISECSAYIALIEHNLYSSLLYYCWIDPQNYQKFSSNYFNSYFQQLFWASSERSRISNILDFKYGIKDKEDVNERIKKSLNSLSLLLEDQDYFFGNSPSSLDAHAYGILTFYDKLELPNTEFKEMLEKHKNLKKFLNRIEKLDEKGFIELETKKKQVIQVEEEKFDYKKTYVALSIVSISVFSFYYFLNKEK